METQALLPWKIAIVGRPNVGKSALFNRLSRQRIAIVDEAEGITRDRIYSQADCFGKLVTLIDTGGISTDPLAPFQDEIVRQAEIAIEEADSLIMVVDSQVGITDQDLTVARLLKKSNKPLVLAVNKIDDIKHQSRAHDFHSLGIAPLIGISSLHGYQIAELLEAAVAPCPPDLEPTEIDPAIKIAVVGRPNVGKSSLLNTLLDEKRCVVSPIPGTTRDSIDVKVTFENSPYTFIDTAGIRRKQAEHEVVDKFAAIRTQNAIERADVCILMLDAQEGITTQEKHIASQIEEAGKGCIVALNKWDLVKGYRMEHLLKALHDQVPFLQHCPKLFISAKTGRNLEKLFPLTTQVHANAQVRIATHPLNTFIERIMQKTPPPMINGKRLRVYYMAQVKTAPPTFVLFINKIDRITTSYRRYILNQLRKEFSFEGVPLVLRMKAKSVKE